MSTHESIATSSSEVLPWLSCVERQSELTDVTPGEYVLRTLFSEFTILTDRKLEHVLAEPLEKPLSKSLQRGEDPQFDQLLRSLNAVAKYSLSSLLKTLFQWYSMQKEQNPSVDVTDGQKNKNGNKNKGASPDSPKLATKVTGKEMDYLMERRDHAIDFLLCLVLIEVLKQLPEHPVDDSLTSHIESLAFKCFKQRSSFGDSPSATNAYIIAALYAEVIGVLAQTRFQSVRKRFLAEFKENAGNSEMLVNVICGMKYLRIKLFPVEHVEETFMFLQDCANVFIDTRDKDKEVKYALAGVFVEILVPVAATAKREFHIPALKNFIDLLYPYAFDMSKKNKHLHAMYPLVAVLMCVSQKQFFLTHWPFLLNACLTNIKHRDTKLQRICLECLYRMLWVYVIRIKGENNPTTLSRLRSVTDTLFPRGSRVVNPRDVPITIFVKIVHFISHYNLEFAMQDIIFDLLSVGRFRQIYPERMNIGLRSFLVIVDSLQKKEGDPPMPNTTGTLPSGSSLRVKKSFLNKPLTEEAAKDLGISKYFHSVCKALDSILHNLDLQVGRPLMKNNPQCSNKDPYDMITGERKPKIDLFRTSVASIPKLIPHGMSKNDIVGLLSRLTIHVDEELRSLAFSSLQSLILDFVEWREDIIVGFVNFIMREVQDHHATLLDGLLRMVLKMLAQWKTLITMPESERKGTFQQADITIPMSAIHCIEGCGLAMLCSVRQIPRKLALLLLKEARVLGNLVAKNGCEIFVMDIIDEVSSDILTNALKNLSPEDKSLFGSSINMDLQWFVDRLPSGFDTETGECGDARYNDLWCLVISQLLLKKHIPDACPVATQFSWQAVHHRLFFVYSFIDQSTSGMDSLTSLGSFSTSRSAKKVFNLSDIYLWQNYLMFACTVHPISAIDQLSCDTDNGNSSDEGKSDPRPSTPDRVESLFRFAVALVRNESSEIRNAVITCLGRVSPVSYKEFFDELQVSLLQYVLEKRTESMRKRKKRDNIRTYLARIFELNAEHGCFRESPSVLSEEGALSLTFVEYIENTRLYFCSGEADRDPSAVHQLKLNFARFIHKMIKSFPHSTLCKGQLLTNELRRNLFSLLSSWFSKTGTSPPVEKMSLLPPDKRSELEIAAIQALCAVLCCGPVFDKCGLTNDGYFYKWIGNVLCSPDKNINCIGQETLELLLDLNDDVPSVLEWVINKCYTGSKVISNKCFQALTTVMIRRPYPCEAIAVINVVLFKTSSADPGEREKAAQLLQLLERRFLSYCVPGLSKYSQSPMELSDRLANFHPELTIPLLAELTYRFETAPFAYQRIILKYMLPWLCNVQLVDIASNRTTLNTRDTPEEDLVNNTDRENPLPHVEMTGDGWGSSKATQLVLNNLFFLTVKYGEDFNAEFEELWSALSNAWIGNNHEILNYLNILAGVAAHREFFPHAKRLVVYLVRANKEGTIQTLMDELQLTEAVAPQFERCDQPPYYTILYKEHSTSILAESEDSKEGNINEIEIKKDIDVIVEKAGENIEQMPNNISGSCKDVDEKFTPYEEDNKENPSPVSDKLDWAKAWVSAVHNSRQRCFTSGLPLPIPQSELRFAALVDVLPLPQMVTPLYRCNFSLILLSEVIRDQPRVNWLPHLPLMLHVVFLGFDHSKSLIHEHCKSLLVNLAVILVLQGDYSNIAHALMKFQYFSHCAADLRYNAGSSMPRDGTVLSLPEKEAPSESDLSKLENQVGENNVNWTEKVKWLIWYLTQSEGKPLWSFEDITAKCHDIKSATELTEFLVRVLDIFDSKFQGNDIRGSWARVASKWAISCSSRHYAGRSFQVLRGLAVQLSWSVLSDILSRLAESIGDNNEDVQGYVMEILLTLDSVVEQSGENHVKPKVVILSMGNEDDNDEEDNGQMLGTSSPERSIRSLSNKSSGGHIRSLSSGCDLRGRFSQFEELSPKMRSVSLQSLRFTNDNTTTLSQTDLLSRIFWVAVSLLESDYEHEFVMAVKLLSKVLNVIDLTHRSTLERLESLLYKLKWSQFSGVQMLLLKGLTSAATSAPTIELIKNTTPYSNISIMDVSEYSGVALSILALLPYMIQRFNEPDEFCLSCAATVGQVCVNNNMLGCGKLFAMYNQRTYHKNVQMWTEGVCRYIYEFYRQSIRTLLAFLTELLERGPQINQTAVLNITCALMRHIDFKLSSTRHILIPTLKVISKHIKDDLWKESLNVLKLAVSSCSQLEIPVQRASSLMFDSTWSLNQSAAARLELPGKTLDFTFDVSTTLVSPQENQDVPQKGLNEASGWKRPQLSQRRTKERLVSVLHVCGHHIGLKQSPSVVFSSSSDLMIEKQPGSDHSSSDENQYVEGDSKEGEQANEAQQLIGVFTGFDFLDDEIDEHDDDISGFGWDLPSGEYTTPEPGDSRLRHSPLSGSEPDIVAAYRLDTSDEDDEITRPLSSAVSPSIAMPLTEEALRAHDRSKGFSPSSHYNPPSESSQESVEFPSPRLPRFVTSVLDTHNIDEQWRSHVTALVNDTSGSTAVNTFALLALLLRQIRRRVNEITRQCCNVLDNSLFGVTSLFVEILEAEDVQGHCPHVYMDSETVRRSKILERQKFMVLEIDDHYRSYKEMFHNAGRALERLRSAAKPQGEYPSPQDRDMLSAEESKYEDYEITLCWALYKLHFQVLLFLDSYSRLFEHLQKQASKADIVDLTNKVGLVRNEITSALVSVKHASAEPSLEQAVDTSDTHTYASVTESIMRNLHTNNTEFAVRTLYVFREILHTDSDQDAVEFLTKLYARYLVERKTGAMAMSKPEFTLPSVISELKEMTIHVLSVIEQLSPADKT